MIIKLMLSRLLIPHLGTSIDNPYFEGMVNQIYPPELQLNKANISDTEAPFLDLHLSVSNGFVSSKIYDKRDDFDFDIVNSRRNSPIRESLTFCDLCQNDR